MDNEPAVTDPITDQLRLIWKNVPGIRGSIIATSDGLVVAHDVYGLEPTQVAALVAATHAVAARASLSTACGQLNEVITRGSDGYLAVYAAGGAAIIGVLGTAELNVAMLNFQARMIIARIAEHLTVLARRPEADSSAVPAARTGDNDACEGGESLPVRHRG